MLSDESGQDLIEYSLLLSVIAAGLILVFDSIGARMVAAYQRWMDPTSGTVNALWIPNDPA